MSLKFSHLPHPHDFPFPFFAVSSVSLSHSFILFPSLSIQILILPVKLDLVSRVDGEDLFDYKGFTVNVAIMVVYIVDGNNTAGMGIGVGPDTDSLPPGSIRCKSAKFCIIIII